MRDEKDVSIGVNFRTPVENCLFLNAQKLSASSSVISGIITHISKRKSAHHRLSIQMLIPHIMSNDEYGKIVDETNLLFENYE